MQDKYEEAVAVLYCRSTLETFKIKYLLPIADRSWDMSSTYGIEMALRRFFDPYHRKWGKIHRMYRRLSNALYMMGLTPDDFIRENMSAYLDLSEFDHMFRKFCLPSPARSAKLNLPQNIHLTRAECVTILNVVPLVSKEFRSILKDIDNELYSQSL